MNTYPLTLVVSTSKELAKTYNDNFDSHYMLSECISPADARKLAQNNAKINKIVLVDGAGADLVPFIGAQLNWNEELMPVVENYSMSDTALLSAVNQIHSLIKKKPDNAGMG